MNAKSTGRKVSPNINGQSTATKSTRATSPCKPADTSARPSTTAKRRPPKISASTVPSAPTVPSGAVGTSKQARVIALLGSAGGASIAQMIALTGWQAHTVRGTISGVLRKRLGLTVECAAGESGARVYRIVAATSA